MPAWVDNGLHSHGKRELVPLAVDGLLLRAISRCSDQLSDGFIEATWVEKQLTDGLMTRKQRERIIELALEHRVLERINAGDSRLLTGVARPGLRKAVIEVVVGPVSADGFLVHDFLDCNRSRAEVEERRAAEAEKKRQRRGKAKQEQLQTEDEVRREREAEWDRIGRGGPLYTGESSSLSPGESPRESRGASGDRKEVNPRYKETDLNDARAAARSSDPKVQSVIDVLKTAPRLFIQPEAIENALAAHPNADHELAAREAVQLALDPTWRSLDGGRLMMRVLGEQKRPTPSPFAGRSSRPTPDDFQALKTAGGVA